MYSLKRPNDNKRFKNKNKKVFQYLQHVKIQIVKFCFSAKSHARQKCQEICTDIEIHFSVMKPLKVEDAVLQYVLVQNIINVKVDVSRIVLINNNARNIQSV